ncbi:TetR/AcrR family transcriptional regulator [Rossellomorea aquimaris]|uniref:TetR/AcrR family transcriptional regulator n=1 Tax=Rossellomorea aquimaris TaxID=189382 RepID=A0A5D4U431_9BACI|nr:TetR/AcrR family transcriptional regulator [Rossellomorea aquimaris]TYS82028.1 TetR/AcrR family transcriptional regulator [Rossellomorea aquimaris]TYS88652.1 TetR/AcrR family transcriptional regulator [Rossellomorea aquimaris]
MAGLREDKKRQTQQNIMEAAKHIFSEKGYQQASMAEIAKDAGVGTGTIYNYFPSKGSLLLRIFSEEAEEMKGALDDPYEDEGDLVQSVIGAMHGFTEFFQHYPKAFWRELFHVMTEEVEESIRLRQGLFGIDEEMMKWIMFMIESHSGCFLVKVDPQEAAYAIYSAAMSDTMFYMYNESMNHEEYKEQLSRHIRFLFEGKIKSGKKE